MAFCISCGSEIKDGTTFCSKCGMQQSSVTQQQTTYQQPVYQQPVYQQPTYVKPRIPGRGFAITSMILGIFALMFSLSELTSIIDHPHSHGVETTLSNIVGSLSFPVLALTFGFSSKKSGYQGGMCTAGMVTGIVSLALMVTTLILAYQ